MKSVQNLLLLSCRSPYLDSDKVYPPLGNLYLDSIVKRDKPITNVSVKDDYSLDDPSWLDGFDTVGISVMTPQRAEARKLLDFIKKSRPETQVIVGGPHAKYYGQEMISEPWDRVVTHDAERVMTGVLWGIEGRVLTDNIPAGEFGKWAVKPNRLGNADFLKGYNYKLKDRNGVERDSTTAFFARGCPQACHFCEDALTTVRWTPKELIKEELNDIKALGYTGLYIFDDIFAIAMPRVKPICEDMAKHGFIYRCNGQANYFTKWGEDFAKMLADTGCVEIAFGHESGSQRILDAIDKRTTVEQNYLSVEFAKKHGIRVKSFLMLGLPTEDLESIADTEKFIKNAGMDDFQLAVYMPFKGTQIRDAIDRGEGQRIDLQILPKGLDGEVTGAYGIKGGESSYEVRTRALSSKDLEYHRNRLVNIYKPQSHSNKWAGGDGFFETHLATGK